MRLPGLVAPIVANNTYKIRRGQGISRDELAERCQRLLATPRYRDVVSPFTKGALMNMEFGRRVGITTEEVSLLAAALGVTTATLTKASRIVAPFDAARKRARPSNRHPKTEIVRRKEMAAALGISNPTLSRWIRSGQFPAGIRLGRNSVGYEWSTVREFLAARPPAGGTTT